MAQEALIIFVRKPELGKVKTRLAATVGNAAALAIYEKLLAHTRDAVAPLSCDKYVFYNEAIEPDDMWSNGYHKLVQADADLGVRMKVAFAHLFGKGYKRVCIVGSDCFELTTGILQKAFGVLQENDVVVGPALDGGYYLLGMKNEIKEVFNGVEWSTGKVFEQTKQLLHHCGYSYALLPALRDVDTVDDVPKGLLPGIGDQAALKK